MEHKVTTEAGYRALLEELDKLAPGEYITDPCVDRENIPEGMTEWDEGYWGAMASVARFSAEQRLDEVNQLKAKAKFEAERMGVCPSLEDDDWGFDPSDVEFPKGEFPPG